MKAKLIKKDEHYFLEVQPCTLSTSQKYTIIANTFDKPKGDILQLSLKNCQAIERGYDLDELADEYCTHEPKNAKELRDVNLVKLGFRDGFQKALELMGDKKFSENEANKIWKAGQEYWKTSGESITFEELIERRNELLQQTEWDVEICCLVNGYDGTEDSFSSPMLKSTGIPKLDADGCLILKRKP